MLSSRLPANFWLHILIGLFFLMPLVTHQAAAASELSGVRRVLLLHSYHSNMPWAEDITTGVRSILNLDDTGVELDIEYMDTKRVSDETYLEQLFQLYLRKYRDVTFDAIITADDDAFQFVLKHRQALFPGAPVIFCGVNRFTPELIRDQPDITGVIETTDHVKTINLALSLHPRARRVYIINDRTTTGLILRQQVENDLGQLQRSGKIVFLDDLTMAELEARLRQLTRDDIVYLMTFHRDKAGQAFSSPEVMNHIHQASPAPIYATGAEYMGRGIVGGYLNWGYRQGEEAARLALRVLEGEQAGAIPVIDSSLSPAMFDGRQLSFFGLDEKDLPQNSIIRYRPVSLYHQYWPWVWGFGLFLIAETVFIAILLTNRALRRQAETALRQSEEKFSRIFRAAPMATSISTLAEGRFIDVNDSFARLLGYSSPDEIIGRTSTEINLWIEPEDRQRIISLARTGRKVGQHNEGRVRTRSGEIRMVMGSAEVVEIGGRACLLIMLFDVTERKRLEEQLRQGLKMEAVGRLAGGVAHDFNNLLTVILGNCDLMLSEMAATDQKRRDLEQIRKAGERAAGLTRQLLAFSRRQAFQPAALDLNEIVAGMEKMLQRLIGEDINLLAELQPGLRAIEAEPGQIEQVVMNLVVNARDAMPRGGTLTIRTDNIYVDEAEAGRHVDVKPGWYVQLVIRDTGQGMDETTRTHLFEPFFTTKEQGRGTGLGLAMVHGIVKQSDGYITVESAPDQGTTFIIYLPGISIAPERDEHRLTGSYPGTETILLVEDETGVRELVRHVLQGQGYSVLEAQHGPEAIAIGQQFDGPIHLLLTDVIMPGGLSGPELSQRLSAARPEIKTLYMSGYTDNRITDHVLLNDQTMFLQKPFNAASLTSKIREMLDRDHS